jgi:hypothetical protein
MIFVSTSSSFLNAGRRWFPRVSAAGRFGKYLEVKDLDFYKKGPLRRELARLKAQQT